MVYSVVFLLFLHPKGYIITELSIYVKEKRKEYRLTQVDLSRKSEVGLRFVRELEQRKETLMIIVCRNQDLNNPKFGYVIQMNYLCTTKWYNYENIISNKKTDLVSIK